MTENIETLAIRKNSVYFILIGWLILGIDINFRGFDIASDLIGYALIFYHAGKMAELKALNFVRIFSIVAAAAYLLFMLPFMPTLLHRIVWYILLLLDILIVWQLCLGFKGLFLVTNFPRAVVFCKYFPLIYAVFSIFALAIYFGWWSNFVMLALYLLMALTIFECLKAIDKYETMEISSEVE